MYTNLYSINAIDETKQGAVAFDKTFTNFAIRESVVFLFASSFFLLYCNAFFSPPILFPTVIRIVLVLTGRLTTIPHIFSLPFFFVSLTLSTHTLRAVERWT